MTEFEISFDNFHRCIDTWIPTEREGYRLYANEQLSNGNNEYFLTRYSWSNQNGDIIEMGYCTITPKTLDKSAVNSVLEDKGFTTVSESQWETVVGAYNKLCDTILPDMLFEGVPQLYKTNIYHEVPEFQQAMERSLDDIHQKIEKYEEYENEEDKDWYDEYENFARLGDDQYHFIGEILEEAIDWDASETVPYVDHCQLAATLEFETYENWELRALEHLQNGILANKPELAKTKALLEEGFSQSEIVEKLGKTPSTVSRQVATINNWESRAAWTLKQNNPSEKE